MPTISLPQPIDRYFALGKKDAAECFAEDATVYDNGEDTIITGSANIREWLAGTSDKYSLTSEATGVEEREGAHHVHVIVSGNFPGSPYEFDYAFTLAGEKIAQLAIDPIGSLA